MRVLTKSLSALLLCATCWVACAGDQPAPIQAQVQVTSLSGSKLPTSGYFAITTAAPVAGCEAGFWLPVSDPSYTAWLARARAALADKAPVSIIANPSLTGPEPSDKLCRISALG